MTPLRDVPLAPLTTLSLGGPAAYFVEATSDEVLLEALAWAQRRALPVRILGSGSNLVVGDRGVDGLVVHMAQRGVHHEAVDRDVVRVSAQAGEPWDDFVAHVVAEGLWGLECLSGIPGQVGATPIQNVGAYGQEVAQTIERVKVLDRHTRRVEHLSPADCGFAYRESRFKRNPQTFVVLEVTFRLRRNGQAALRYRELEAAFAQHPNPSLQAVRDQVLQLRRRKSMVLDPADPNRRSAGSFFKNPVVPEAHFQRFVARTRVAVPHWPTPTGVKLAAAWLIEQSGYQKGHRRGPVGISSAHALALVHHGGGRTQDLLALARDIQEAVQSRFDIELEQEPVHWHHA